MNIDLYQHMVKLLSVTMVTMTLIIKETETTHIYTDDPCCHGNNHTDDPTCIFNLTIPSSKPYSRE